MRGTVEVYRQTQAAAAARPAAPETKPCPDAAGAGGSRIHPACTRGGVITFDYFEARWDMC